MLCEAKNHPATIVNPPNGAIIPNTLMPKMALSHNEKQKIKVPSAMVITELLENFI